MKIVYPAVIDSKFKKYYFCYRLQEKLQLVHNIWGDKFDNGEITKAEWERFLHDWYNPRDNLVIREISRLRALAKNHNWNVNLNDIFME